jgi:signal transduction histidine kinase
MPSIRILRPRQHPFPFLLYGEWVLLGMALISEFTPSLLPKNDGLPFAAWGAIIGFGLLGGWLPVKPLGLKIGHVLLQFCLILLAARFSAIGLRLFPLLYIVLVLRSCLLFGLAGRLLVTSVSFVFFIGMVQTRIQSLDRELSTVLARRVLPQLVGIRLNLVVMFFMLLVFLLLLMNALLAERERREELRQANQKLRDTAAQIEKLAMAQERTRIAREIHDSLGHALTGLNIQLEGALKLWDADPAQAKNFVAQAKEMGSMALREARQSVATLREPLPSSQQDLASAIAVLAQRVEQMTGVLPSVTVASTPLPEFLKLTVYRIVQEALTNTCKYAQADQVAIAVQPTKEASQLHIQVQDNGVGFNPQDNTTGFGLRGIQERAAAEAGQFRLTTAPGQGCTVDVWLPLSLEAS